MARRASLVLAIALALAGGAARAARPEIVIDPTGVPAAALTAITGAVDAIARLADDQDGGEMNRLRRRAHDATLSALATEGYFSPEVTLDVGSDIGGETWDITIDAGPQAMVSAVDLQFSGRISQADFAQRVESLRGEWPLQVGKPFINSEWNRAKSSLLDSVASHDFLLARMSGSAAQVDVASAQVAVSVKIDSGPQVLMGPMRTYGFNRVPASLAHRYIRYQEGEPFDQDRLNDWQQDLQSTAFFRGAFVSLDASIATGAPPGATDEDDDVGHVKRLPEVVDAMLAGDPEVSNAQPSMLTGEAQSKSELTLPVQVRVVEAPPKRVAASLGIDDDAGVRVEGLYRQNVVQGLPVTLSTGAGVDRLRQRAFVDFNLPPDVDGNRDAFGVLVDRSDIQGLEVTRFALGATRLKQSRAGGDSRVEYETRWGALLAHDRVRIENDTSFNLPSATGTFEWLRRDVNDKYDPREGNLVALGLGVGLTLNQANPYTRARLRAQQWWPVGERDVLTLRGELGRVWSNSDIQVPDDFGFRTGGARTIRGYRYQSIGARRGTAVVGAATLAVASLEYDHYLNERWGLGVFVDAGDAADSFGDMDIAVGYGVGARVRTPAGPLALDLAYGQREKDLRLHFSLGIAF